MSTQEISFFPPDPRVDQLERRMHDDDTGEAIALAAGVVMGGAGIIAIIRGNYSRGKALLVRSAVAFGLVELFHIDHDAAENEILFPTRTGTATNSQN